MTTTSAPPTDDLPCDLLEFLAETGGIEMEAATSLLGDFLMEYEPQAASRLSFAKRLAA
jgi:hypothetical protein